MKTINLLSDCVSRDSVTRLCELRDNSTDDSVKVFQYPCSVNIVSMTSEAKGDFQLDIERLEKYELKNFYRKGLCFDFNKTYFDYLFSRKSDYLIISLNGARFNLLKKGEHIISKPLPRIFSDPSALHDLGLDDYEEIPIEDITAEQWQNAVDIVCEKVLRHYTPSQIIFHKHYGVTRYDSDGCLKRFSDEQILEIKKFNRITARLDKMFLKKLDGCHVIEFPQMVIGDRRHKWGLCHLHYIDKYYTYVAEALDIIIGSDTEKVKQQRLSRLFEIYDCYFKAHYRELALELRVKSPVKKKKSDLQDVLTRDNKSRSDI